MTRQRIITVDVLRYEGSGRLVAGPVAAGQFLPLNEDLSFSSRAPHFVRRGTPLRATGWVLELEERPGNQGLRWTRVRAIRADSLAKPLEGSMPDLSPSEVFTDAERAYAGEKAAPAIFSFMVGSIAFSWLLFFSDRWWWVPLVVTGAGLVGKRAFSKKADPAQLALLAEKKAAIRLKHEDARRQLLSTLAGWRALSGHQFEHAVARHFRSKGWNDEVTPRSRDGGVDLVLRRSGEIIIVQCKKRSGVVGVDVVRELVGARSARPRATGAWVVALNGFSPDARRFAEQNGVRLISIADEIAGL